MKYLIIIAFTILSFLQLNGSDTILIENNKIRRTILIDSGKINTIDFVSKEIDYDFHRLPSVDFSFEINDEEISGSKGYFIIEQLNPEDKKNIVINLTGLDNTPAENIEINIHYNAPAGTEGTRKWFKLKNKRKEEILISDICVENLNLDPWGSANSLVQANWGRDLFKPSFNMQMWTGSQTFSMILRKDHWMCAGLHGIREISSQLHV